MSFDGTYAVSVFTGRGEKKDRFTIETIGDRVTGTYYSSEMGLLPFSDVQVDGNTVEWALYFNPPPGAGGPTPGITPPEGVSQAGPPPDGPMKIPFKVTFNGDKVTGKLSMAGDTPFDVVGEKVPE